jgi:hypothetical protein
MQMDLTAYGRRHAQQAEAESAPRPGDEATARTHDNVLTARAQALTSALPHPIRLNELLNYPHVVNRLADLWGFPVQMRAYLEELLLDSRGTRHGFPLGVIAELTALRSYYETRVHPVRADVWSTVRRRS